MLESVVQDVVKDLGWESLVDDYFKDNTCQQSRSKGRGGLAGM
jgi:hypothetical protein